MDRPGKEKGDPGKEMVCPGKGMIRTGYRSDEAVYLITNLFPETDYFFSRITGCASRPQ